MCVYVGMFAQNQWTPISQVDVVYECDRCMLVCWYIGMLVCWYVGEMCVGVLVSRKTQIVWKTSTHALVFSVTAAALTPF